MFADTLHMRSIVLSVPWQPWTHPHALPEVLFIIRHLDDERHVERVLKPLGKHKRDQVTQMQ